MEQQRIEWIDRAKGIAIFLVLFGHMCSNGKVTAIIYAFHMPLFFFLSGVVFRYEKYPQFSVFLKKKFLDLMIPCLLFNMIFFIWKLVYVLLLHGNGNLWKNLAGILVQNRGTEYSCGAWFITCAFCMEVILYGMIRLAGNKRKIICLFSFVALIVGYCYCKLIHVTMPWNIDAAVMAVFFGGLGYCSKTLVEKIKVWQMVLYLLLVPVALLNYRLNNYSRVEMWGNSYGNLILFVAGAFLGGTATIALAKQAKIQILEYYGKQTLYLYGMQLVFAEVFKLCCETYHLYSISMVYSVGIAVVLTVLLFAVLTPLKKPYDKILHSIKQRIS